MANFADIFSGGLGQGGPFGQPKRKRPSWWPENIPWEDDEARKPPPPPWNPDPFGTFDPYHPDVGVGGQPPPPYEKPIPPMETGAGDGEDKFSALMSALGGGQGVVEGEPPPGTTPDGEGPWNRPPTDGTTAPAGFDFWTALAGIFGEDYEAADLDRLKTYLTGNKRWRVPRKAQEMLEFAQAMSGFGDEGQQLAQQMAMSALAQGWNRPQWNLSSIFANPLQRYGYGGQSGATQSPWGGGYGQSPWG